MNVWILLILLVIKSVEASNGVYFYKKRALTIQNVGEHLPYKASNECARLGYRWIAVVDSESNDVIQTYMKENGIEDAWLGLLQSFGGSFTWLGISSSPTKLGYSNWAAGDPKKGYVYMDAESGTWKTTRRPVKKTVLCVSLSSACEKDNQLYAEGFEGTFGCHTCTCKSGHMNCKETSSCIKTSTQGCYYNNKLVPEGQEIDAGCKRCTCVKQKRTYKLTCTECEAVDYTIGTEHETKYRQQSMCPPLYQDRGFKWIDCTYDEHSGCDKYCEIPNSECRRKCVPRCACPPEKPYLSHGFCKPECPGRRFSPVIVQGLSNRVLPESEEELEIKCTSIGEPTPEVMITDAEFTPDLRNAPLSGQLGIRTASTTYQITKGVLPNVIYCYAWNINGVSKSSATFTVVSRSDSNYNTTVDRQGRLKMPPVVRLGIESLVLGSQFGQRMKCVATGAPKPKVQIVKLQDGTAFPSINANAEPGLHDVVAEATVLIDTRDDAGVYACLAVNKHGAVKDETTLSFVDKAPSPGEVGLILKASGFVKDDVTISEWPFLPTENTCTSSNGMKYEKYQQWKEDCNTCTCLEDGKTYCTDYSCRARGSTCTSSNGKKYKKYQQWKEDCNTCTCLDGGSSFCTDNECETVETACTSSNGKKYKKYQQWKEDCNTCTCLDGGSSFCTDNECETATKSDVQCRWFGGKMYNVGEVWKHGCKSCSCHESGRPLCTDSNCGAECSYNGRRLTEGVTFTDNCRTCRCNADGGISCEGDPCPEPKSGCSYKGREYEVTQRFKDGCKTCRCWKNGLVTCSQGRCLPVKKQCIFQKVRQLPHGTQLQVECNICSCNDGVMSCTEDKCEGVDTNKEGCRLEGEQRKYEVGSVIQMGLRLCKCSNLGHAKVGKRILDFICD